VALGDRVQFARARQAALFISIHADAVAAQGSDAQGATVIRSRNAPSDARAARLAEAENKPNVIAGLDLSSEEKDVAGILNRSCPGARDQDVFGCSSRKPWLGRSRTRLPAAAPTSLELGVALCRPQGRPTFRRSWSSWAMFRTKADVKIADLGTEWRGPHRRFDRPGGGCLFSARALAGSGQRSGQKDNLT